MSLAEVVNAAKWSSGFHGDGAAAPAPDFGFLFPNKDKQQKTQLALQLLQYQAQKAATEAAIAKRKQDLWNSVGTPAVSDKSTAGDVASIVDTEKVGGRDANVSNRGDSWLNSETYNGQDPALMGIKNQQSKSPLVNLVANLVPTINSQGDMTLAKKPKTKASYTGAAKRYDEAKTFSYAKRLADQSIIADGKSRKDLSSAEYSELVKSNIGKAEKYLYGQQLSQEDKAAAPVKNDDPTGIVKAIKTGMDLGTAPAPGEQGSAPQVQAYTEGQTAINPKTGKRLAFKGGKWQPLN